jgi:hypothetical protein
MSRRNKAKTKSAPFKSFRIRGRGTRIRRIPRRFRKPNYWHQHDDRTYSKIAIRDVELLWLDQYAPTAVVSWEKVPGCETMPLYKQGKWDGMAHFVRFTKEDLSNAIMFRIVWWNTRA